MYCTRCGRELQDGEICTCGQDDEQVDAVNIGTVQEDETSQKEPEQKESVSAVLTGEVVSAGVTEQKENAKQEWDAMQEKIKDTFKGSKEAFRNSREAFRDSKEAEWMKEKGGETAKKVKSGFLGIAQIWKSPVTVTQKWVEENVKRNGMCYIAAKAVLMLLVAFGISAYLNSQMGMLRSYFSIPYFRFVLIALLLSLGADLVETVLLDILGKVFGGKAKSNAMFSVVGVRAAYDLTIIVVTAVIAFIAESKALYVGGALLMLEFYVEFACYGAAIDMNENRKVYAYFLSKLVTMTIIGALSWGMIKDLIDLATRIMNFF